MSRLPKSITEPRRYVRLRQLALGHGFHNLAALHRAYNARSQRPVSFPFFYRVCAGQRRSPRIARWINRTLNEDVIQHD